MVSSAWLLAGGAGDWSVCNELRSVSPRYEYIGTDLVVTRAKIVGSVQRHAKRGRPGVKRRRAFEFGKDAISLRLLPLRFPGIETTRPPFGGLSEVLQISRKSGAGEGIRTLDPDLGKVVLLLQRLAACDRSGL